MSFIKSLLNLFSSRNVQSQNTMHNPNHFIVDENNGTKFYMDNREYINPLKQELLDFSMKANGKITDIDTTIANCKKTPELYEKLKNYCYKTQAGIVYFEELWKPKNPNSFVVITKKRLQDLTENYDERKKYYENRQYVKTDLKKELILLISEQENILQKDVYLKFDSSLKNSISRVLSDMEKSGELERTKHGNSYQLSIKRR